MFSDSLITSNVTNCLEFKRWRHIINMSHADPALFAKFSTARDGGPPDRIRAADQTPIIGLMAILIEECEIFTHGHVQTGPKEAYGVRRVSGLPFMGAWDYDSSMWGKVLDFTGPIYAPISTSGISFMSQGQGKGIVLFSLAG
jgi:hypothetical protein